MPRSTPLNSPLALLDESKLEQGTDDLVPFLTISSPTVDTSELTPDTEDLVLLLLLLGPKPVNLPLDTPKL